MTSITSIITMSLKLSPKDDSAHEKFDEARTQVLNLRDNIKGMTDTEILLFIPDGSYEFKEAYTNAIRILMTDIQNTNWNKVSPDSWLSFAMLVMMDGIFWKKCTILEYNRDFYQTEWLMVGIFELNSYAGHWNIR